MINPIVVKMLSEENVLQTKIDILSRLSDIIYNDMSRATNLINDLNVSMVRISLLDGLDWDQEPFNEMINRRLEIQQYISSRTFREYIANARSIQDFLDIRNMLFDFVEYEPSWGAVFSFENPRTIILNHQGFRNEYKLNLVEYIHATFVLFVVLAIMTLFFDLEWYYYIVVFALYFLALYVEFKDTKPAQSYYMANETIMDIFNVDDCILSGKKDLELMIHTASSLIKKSPSLQTYNNSILRPILSKIDQNELNLQSFKLLRDSAVMIENKVCGER